MTTFIRLILLTRHTLANAAVTALLLAAPSAALAQPMKVAFLSPDPPENLFWGKVMDFMRAVAADLNIELDVVISNGNSTYAMKRDGMKIINRSEKPDYILTGYWNDATDHLIEAAADKGVGVFIFNTNISVREKLKVDEPRVRHPHWIGHMMPDDVGAGYELAGLLVEQARSLKPEDDAPITMGALSGTADSAVSSDRNAGLEKQIQATARVKLAEILHTSWHRPTATKVTEELLQRHPQISAVWTVADALALGAIDVLKAQGRQPGVEVVTGGMDWSDEGIQAVKRGEMAATMGGHFMEGGWALILTHDYHHGIDFAEELGVSMVTPMTAITADNVDEYLDKLGDQNWEKIDFTQFSKKYDTSLKQYDFSLDTLLERANPDE